MLGSADAVAGSAAGAGSFSNAAGNSSGEEHGTKGGKGKGPQQTFLGQSIMGLGPYNLMGASLCWLGRAV